MKTLGTSAATALILALLLLARPGFAHSPICNCYDNLDGTVTCEGGFSDGASAEGVAMRIVDESDRVLLVGEMDARSTYTFDMPDGEFHVIFDAGMSHIVTIFSGDIE